MASLLTPLFLPADLVPFVPLLSWSFALQWFIDEYQFHSSWTKISPELITSNHDEALGQYFQQWFPLGGRCAAVTTPLVWSSSLVTLYHQRNLPWLQNVWTGVGFGLTIYHVKFGGGEYAAYKRLGAGGTKGQNLKDLRSWVGMHKTRTWVIDVPAWVCFAITAVQSVRRYTHVAGVFQY